MIHETVIEDNEGGTMRTTNVTRRTGVALLSALALVALPVAGGQVTSTSAQAVAAGHGTTPQPDRSAWQGG
ncbi:hypothetical protein [Streptomyces sp. NPDC005780]|uniref:hypothetical protein n=1 Tax=Streptomyces sp. NPDC005780 TaxID=3364730 RepID=UPI003678DCD0